MIRPLIAVFLSTFLALASVPASVHGQEKGRKGFLAVLKQIQQRAERPVRFRFFGSTTRKADVAGTELERWKDGELVELSPIEVTLPTEGRRAGDVVPVRLHAEVTETGTLLLAAIPTKPQTKDERWKVELSVRHDG